MLYFSKKRGEGCGGGVSEVVSGGGEKSKKRFYRNCLGAKCPEVEDSFPKKTF